VRQRLSVDLRIALLSTALRGAACALVVTMGMPARSTDCISEHTEPAGLNGASLVRRHGARRETLLGWSIDPMLLASLFCRSAGILFLNPAATSSRLQYSGFANKILDATRMRKGPKGLYQRGVEPSADAWCATCISE
jgi:hypothetical protein